MTKKKRTTTTEGPTTDQDQVVKDQLKPAGQDPMKMKSSTQDLAPNGPLQDLTKTKNPDPLEDQAQELKMTKSDLRRKDQTQDQKTKKTDQQLKDQTSDPTRRKK